MNDKIKAIIENDRKDYHDLLDEMQEEIEQEERKKAEQEANEQYEYERLLEIIDDFD